ncbi:hypothetical protein F511_01256 [Dorcoceras hygrometricum]|uniref:S-protein homolog n=1 Tax=Dorcoceras hygrometricum TaxID=472368 RepID=A0A2Z7BUP6_9LAMI|nr:hypothetical protein F511_01256 [Dorcoceras hygrometricum]
MEYTPTKYIFLFLIISTSCLHGTWCRSVDRTCFFVRKFHVYVVNKLPPNSPPFAVRCQSKDDDLGNRTVGINQMYDFTFCENPYTTLFFCHLWWNGKSLAFDAFNNAWQDNRCVHGDCYYEARADGIYFSGHYPPEDDIFKKYNWP